MKKTLAFTALAFIALTGCAANQNTDSAPAETKTSPAPTNTAETPTPTAETPASTTPTATLTTETKTEFSGTTLKGNEISFTISPKDTQETMNHAVMGTGLTGSWGTLCSPTATTDQLNQTGITSVEQGGHQHLWLSVDTVAGGKEFATEKYAEIANQLVNASNASFGGGQCVIMNTESSSAARGKYEYVSEGYFNGSTIQETANLY